MTGRAAASPGPGTTLIGEASRRLKAHRDPGLAGLRRSVRAALIMPIVFAWTKLAVGDIQIATFAAFGCFAHLVMAAFGGPRGPRAVAYVTTTLVGAVLIVFGTLASSSIALAAAVAMFVVGFCIQFVGVFGGYTAAAQTALQLSFVLAVAIQAPASAIGGRLTGWCLAGAVSGLAGVFLWPRFERVTMRREAAGACRALAALIAAERRGPVHPDPAAAHLAAVNAVGAARKSFTATPKRPAGPARRDRAFVELLIELERILALATGPLDQALSAPHPTFEAGHALADAVIRTLKGSADVLEGTIEPRLDLVGMEAARQTHRQELDRWASGALRAGTPPEEVLEALRTDDALRIIAYLTLALGANAVITAGGRPGAGLHLPAETPSGTGVGATATRIARTLRVHLSPTSNVLHAALRTGAGLGLAVLLARLLQIDHAFWVVLGTLSALRSNALATGRTTLQAIEGTALGFLVGAIFIVAVGTHTNVLWVALPITVFLAAYAAGTIGFVAGQAAFTVLVITLFNLISPVGWRLGLARIEDVSMGAGISLLAGLLLWPRGARGELRQATAVLYRAVASYLGAAFDQVLQPGASSRQARTRSVAVGAHDRAAEAFEQFLRERSAKPLDPLTIASFIAPGAYAILAGDLLGGIAEKGYRAGEGDPNARTIGNQAAALTAGFLALGAQLSAASPDLPAHTPVSEEALRTAAVHGLRNWNAHPGQEQGTIALVTAAEWIHLLAELVATLEAPVAAAAAAIPWWRTRAERPA